MRHFLSLCLCLALLLMCITASVSASSSSSTTDIVAQFREARRARQGVASVTVMQQKDFDKRRAALLAQAAENAPLERDLEWEQQLSSDRRSVHFSKDRSIMDDDAQRNAAAASVGAAGHVAQIRGDLDTDRVDTL